MEWKLGLGHEEFLSVLYSHGPARRYRGPLIYLAEFSYTFFTLKAKLEMKSVDSRAI